MATTLKPVDVAVIGLGATGGVAVLPLARAGLKIAGIEAGTWMDPHRDFHADEIFNNVRRQVTTSPKAQREIPTVRTGPGEKARPPGSSSHDERDRRDIHPLLGPKLAAQGVGFQNTLGNTPEIRSSCDSGRHNA